MKRNILAALLAVCVTAGMVGCDKKKAPSASADGDTSATKTTEEGAAPNNGTSSGGQGSKSESLKLIEKKYADVPEAASGPVIKISDTTAKPGEMAEVTVSVSGTEDKWSLCGIHLRYPDVLQCKLDNEEEYTADYEPGPAMKKSSGFVAMDWQINLSDELKRDKKKSLFFTVMFSDNDGRDGDIATFYLKVPEDARPGTVYDLDYYYMESDMFRRLEEDLSFEKYAFEHLQNGSITVT